MAISESITRHPRLHGSVGQRDLLDRLGTLINESYIAACRTELSWPGSSRHGIHSLTDRYVPAGSDRSTGIGVNVSATAVACTEVPAVHRVRRVFHAAVTLVGQALTDPGVAATDGRNYCGAQLGHSGPHGPLAGSVPPQRRRSMRIPLRASAAEAARWSSMKYGKR